ncbi:MAG TPA: hydrogenase maturation protease [Ktedonobacteraceae bacterium]|nr:hydrogenase maturation protease [Ktedonobacteraceae bacterium]
MNAPSSPQKKVRRILIACIGNIFMGDDGFGVEVAQRLASRKSGRYPQGVEVFDFGIRGVDLAYTLLEDYDTLVLVDAIARGGTPGTLYLIEPDLSEISPENAVEVARVGLDAHSMDPLKVLAFARTLGARPIRTLLIGCEPSVIHANEDYLDMHMGLSQPVLAAVDEAVKMLDSLIEQLLASE